MSSILHERFAAAVDAALAGATVVTPTTRAARMIAAAALRKAGADARACPTPDVLPLAALHPRLWRDALAAGMVSRALLSDARQHAMWAKIIGESRRSRSVLSRHGAAAAAADAWRTAQRYRVKIDTARFASTAESAAWLDWQRAYREECRRSEWIDAACLPDALTSLGPQLADVLPKRLVVYGFEQLTPQDEDFGRKARAAGVEVSRIETRAELRPEAAVRLCADDLRAELHLAAHWARQRVVENPGCSVGIVVPGLSQSRTTVEAIFAEVLHPEEFLSPQPNPSRAFEIASGRPLSGYAMVRDALVALQFAFGDVPIADVGVLLRSPYIGSPEEAAARALYDVLLRDDGWALGSAASFPMDVAAGQRQVKAPPGFAGAVRRVNNLCPPKNRTLAPSDAATLFHDVLDAIGWPSRGSLDSLEFQLRRRWEDLLSEFHSLDGFLRERSAAAHALEVARLADDIAFRPENSGAPVQIMEEDETEGAAFDRLWVCGLTDEAWPRKAAANPYLPVALQIEAGVPGVTPELRHSAAVTTLARFTNLAGEVVFSWPQLDADGELRRTYLLDPIGETSEVGSLCGPAVANCADRIRENAALEFLDDSAAPPVVPESLPRRGTNVLKYQSHCPFRAFGEMRLGAKKMESPQLGLDRRVRGKLVETAIQKMWEKLEGLPRLKTLDEGQIRESLDWAADKAMQQHWRSATDAWSEQMRALERARLRSLLEKWLDCERGRQDFNVAGHQIRATLTLAGVEFHGVADRVDRLTSGHVVVVDYKSGNSGYSVRQWDTDRPDEPQLPFYAVWQMEAGKEVAGIAFACVAPKKLGFCDLSESKEIFNRHSDNSRPYLNGASFGEHVQRWQRTLEALAAAFVEGEAGADPKEPNTTCDNCHLHALCRVAELELNPGSDDGEPEDGEPGA